MLEGACHLWSENDCYALIYDPEKTTSKFKCYLKYYVGFLKGLPCAYYIGLKGYKALLRVVLEGSDWLDEIDNYIHLDMLVVKPDKKGKGYGKSMMTYIFEEAYRRGKLMTLETQSESNRDMYAYFGFDLYKTIEHPAYREYCMIKK